MIEPSQARNKATNLLPARRLAVQGSSASGAANELAVDCPMVKSEVLLQRCAFCEHGRGLLLDPERDSLTLRCSFSESARAKRLRAATDSSQFQAE